MYQNVNKGMVHTVSVEDAIRGSKWNAYYLCGSKDSESIVSDDKFSCCKEKIRLMVAATLDNACLEKALEIIKVNTVEQVILPYTTQEAVKLLRSAGAEKVLMMREGETMNLYYDIWNVSLGCYGEGRDSSIIMYHGPEEMKPESMDCVLNVKAAAKQKPCTVCVDSKNLSCDMRCGLYNDYDVCRSHNAKGRNNYVTGTLLLGNVNLQKYSSSIQKYFEKTIKYVRFISIPESGTPEAWGRMMDWIDGEGIEDKKYFMPLSNEQGNEMILKKILEAGLRCVPLLTSEASGVCASGFFTKRK